MKFKVQLVRGTAGDRCNHCDKSDIVRFSAAMGTKKSSFGMSFMCGDCFLELKREATIGPSNSSLYLKTEMDKEKFEDVVYSKFKFYVKKTENLKTLATKYNVTF